jgi:hypothetical protein
VRYSYLAEQISLKGYDGFSDSMKKIIDSIAAMMAF